jgi:trans-aconitate methyltransferase
MANHGPKVHWTAKAYTASASFVPKLTSTVLAWLDAGPGDKILDLGCGDGVLTAQIKERCASVVGIDASPNLINAAKETYGSISDLSFQVQDCCLMEAFSKSQEGCYTKVFSNAALHWILRDPNTRISVFKAAYALLQPNGTLVFEMGGAGNVAEVHACLVAALVHRGVSIEEARQASPWFFPSEKMIARLLGEAGFVLEKSQLEYRPTELTTAHGGGIEGWVRLMGAHLLELLSPEKREEAVREICDALETILTHEEDGTKWLGYVRLRVAVKKI